MNLTGCRAFFVGSLLLVLTACAVNLPPARPTAFSGTIEPIPAAAPVVIGDSAAASTSFEIINSTRVFERGSTRPAATIDVALAGDRRIVERPWGYEVRATITDASVTSDRRMDATSERNMANIADGLRNLELRMRLDRDRQPLPHSLHVAGQPLAADGSGGMGDLPEQARDLLGRLMEQAYLMPGRRLATGDHATGFTQPLPTGRSFSVREVVEGKVIHEGREAVLLRTEADLPAGVSLATAGYSVVDLATGLPLLWQANMVTVQQGIGSESLVTARYTIHGPD